MIILVMCLMSPGFAAEAPTKSPSMIRTKADFTVPRGWPEYEEMILGEPVLTLSRGLHTLSVAVLTPDDQELKINGSERGRQ